MALAVEIGSASEADAPALAALRYEFRASLLAPAETRADFVARCAAWMAGKLRDPGSGWHCWVARRDSALVGHLWLRLIDKIPNPVAEKEWHAYVTNVYVLPELRGQGVGGRLVACAREWCVSHAVDSIILWPTAESRSLYERHGFRVGDDIMARTAAGAP